MAIELVLTPRLVFHLTLRQADEGEFRPYQSCALIQRYAPVYFGHVHIQRLVGMHTKSCTDIVGVHLFEPIMVRITANAGDDLLAFDTDVCYEEPERGTTSSTDI